MVLIHIFNFNLWLLPEDFTEVATTRCNSFRVVCKTLVHGQGKSDRLFHIYVLFEFTVEIPSSGYLFVLVNFS